MDNKNIEKISSFFKKSKPSIFPIEKHSLESEEEYIKEIYITMLYTIASLDGEMSEGEKIFIGRITEGIGLKQDSTKYIKRALNIDEEILSEFLRSFSGSELAHNFFVDSLILIGASKNISEKNIEIISEYAEILKLTKEQVEFLTELALVILEQSNEKYHELLDRKPENIKSKNFLYYVKQFAIGVIANDEDYEYWTGKIEIKEDGWISKDQQLEMEIKNKTIEIEGAEVTIADYLKIKFNSCRNIIIKDTKFKGYYGLEVENSEEFQINNTLFEGFKARALTLEEILIVDIYNCIYLSCCIVGADIISTRSNGGAISANFVNEIRINKSTFKDCEARSSIGASGGAIYISSYNREMENIELKDNIFVNCKAYGEIWGYDSTVYIDDYCDYENKGKLILKNNKFQNCEKTFNVNKC